MAQSTAITPDPQTKQDTKAQLSILKDSATREYSLKNYGAAAEFYSEATELQAEINGEMNTDNADLLYAYGRCLYHVAVSKSDVLGGKVTGDQEPAKKKKRKTKSTTEAEPAGGNRPTEQPVEDKQSGPSASKPFFQITGDENWTDSEDEDDDAEDADPNAEPEEDDDDFAIAYEILDVARVLLTRKLHSLSQSHEGKGKAPANPQQDTPESRHIMERLADTHDLQAEISLENERFSDAVTDSKSSLDLKLALYPTESSLVAEAHFKLSLALEFASVTQTQPEDEAAEPAPAEVDEDMRKDSISHMESAIESCKLRVAKESASLASLTPEQAKEKQKSIKDVSEMIGDMEQRLIDLRDPSAAAATAPEGGDQNVLGGILGSLLGESQAAQKAKIAEATKTANDLTGLIRHKKKPKTDDAHVAAEPVEASTKSTGKSTTPATEGATAATNGKRKATDEDLLAQAAEKSGKKVKFADDAPAAAI